MIDDFWRQGIISDYWRSLFSKNVAEKFALADQYQHLLNLTKIDGATQKHICDDPACQQGIFYGYGCPKTNFSKCSTLIASSPGNYVVYYSETCPNQSRFFNLKLVRLKKT